MKKIIFMLIISISLISACSNSNSTVNSKEDEFATPIIEETPIKFEVNKTVLSKGYQSINQHVEVLNNGNEFTIQLNLGLVECSDIIIDKITNLNNEINIYTSKITKKETDEIVIPQLSILIKNKNPQFLENKNFNIIGTNYEPIDLPFNKVLLLNNIYSQFKITSNTKPNVNLINEDNKYFWDVTLNYVFDKEQDENSIFNLTAKVDAETGDIIQFNKTIISSYLDDGIIMDLVNDKYLLYKQTFNNDDKPFESLCIYDLQSGEKKEIYTTYNRIFDAKFSYDSKYISLIDNNDKLTEIFVINLECNEIQKITPIGYSNTWNLKWVDKKLYFVNNDMDNKSTVFVYDTTTGQTNESFSLDLNVSTFDVINNKFIFSENNEQETNINLYLTSDRTQLEKFDTGYKVKFLDKDNVLYIKSNQDRNELNLYKISETSKREFDSLSIKDYFIDTKDQLTLIADNSHIPGLTLFKYNMTTDEYSILTDTIGDSIFYDNTNNQIFINIVPPIEGIESQRIYSVKLDDVLE